MKKQKIIKNKEGQDNNKEGYDDKEGKYIREGDDNIRK